ncbi:SDR family oxidoreductase [Ancylobacter pratisalsi]|uniref:SDR family oxidoreductase n=1 Tax=Ancylobacter pratisalsi TaxID=1745854 RepID=A0A6P1YI32_9HYPH|nr:SDR family oxidoreductase [Ancylobacter pratisalsi]QIB32755.1 SDR family oxidoreductase [Ancylobacter pratisalsi]
MPATGPIDPCETRPVALVTGGAVRIGRAICLELARAGYDIALHVRHTGPAGEAVRAEVEALGARAVALPAELADAGAVAGLLPAAIEQLGPVSLLVNNASEFQPDGVGDLDLDRWNRHFDANLRAPVFLSEAFARALPAPMHGAIVNIIDQRVLKPTPSYLSYSLAKNGLWAATRMLAQALAPRIRVNGVGPGPTLASVHQDSEDFARQCAALPLGSGPTPGEIADAVVFLARARSVTGQMIAVDGGQHLAWRTADTETD